MRAKTQPRGERWFRFLLFLFPKDFREQYEGEMQQVFHDQTNEVREQGGVMGLLKLWWETILGIFRTAPSEHLSMLNQDVKYGLRMLRKNPTFALLAVLTLTLGIGANTAIFSVLRSVVLRPLPYRDGQQIVVLHQPTVRGGNPDVGFSPMEKDDYSAAHTFSDVVEYHNMNFTILGKGLAERVRTGVVSAGFFEMFGVKPILGRDFRPEDEKHGAPAVLLFSYEYWQSHHHADPNIVGKEFEMNDRVHTVIGVLPPVPQYPNENDVYMPVSACPFRSDPALIADRGGRMVSLFARMKPHVTLAQSQAEMTTIAGNLHKEYSKFYPEPEGFGITEAPLKTELTQGANPTLLVLFIAAAFVLLIACANVANLTLARMSRREKELILRAALGAGQSRVLRQLVTEGLLIAIPAALLGIGFAWGSLSLLTQFAARLTPRAREISIDGWILAFAMAAAILTSVVFGSLAAFRSRKNLGLNLKEGGSHSTSVAGKRMHGALVVAQVAFSFVVLIGAGLMMRSVVNLMRTDPGFRPERVLTMRLDANWSRLMKAKQNTRSQMNRELGRRVLEKLASQPGFEVVAIASGTPLSPDSIQNGPNINPFQIVGVAPIDPASGPKSTLRAISPNYFRVIGTPLLRGRFFAESDTPDSLPVAIINQSLADQYFKGQDPGGKRISLDGGKNWYTIVGVVGNIRDFGIEHVPEDTIFLPVEQFPATRAVLIRTAGDPHMLELQARQALHEVDPETAVSNMQTLEDARSESIASPRVTAELLAIFGGLALMIASAGVGGVLALLVSQRTREIGIRMAMGAQRANVMWMVMRQGLGSVVIGIVIGGVGGLALTRLFKTLLYEVTPADPFTFVGVAAVFVLAAVAACYLPARRAMHVDPLDALRSE